MSTRSLLRAAVPVMAISLIVMVIVRLGSPDGTQTATCVPRTFTDTTLGTTDGERTFVSFIPRDLTSVKGIIFDFHGTGGTPQAEEALSHLGERGMGAGFVVIQPQALGTPTHWTVPGIVGPDDQALVSSITERVRTALCRADSPTFATGLSAGAGISAALACAGNVRAAAPVAGVALVRRCPDGPEVSMLTFHGTADQAVPYNGVPGWEQKELQPRGFFVGAVEPIMASWATRNGCAATTESTPVGVETQRVSWPGCRDGTETVMYRIEGGGHNPPGTQAQIDALGLNDMIGPSTDDVNATTVILDFFARHTS